MLIWNKIQTVKSLKCVKGMLFIRLCQEQIKIAKQMFTMDIESGSEAYIPKLLSQDSLPMSFRFYDPIMKIVQGLMGDDKKNYFLLKGTTELTVLRKVDVYNEFLERMGFKPS